MSKVKADLYLVHCVDTEGPLTESLEATFQRLKSAKSITIEANLENLKSLQKMEIDLGGREREISDFLHSKRLSYLNNWNSVKKMLQKVTSTEFRSKNSDSIGQPYKFSWFIIDNIGYKNNPRNKAMGFDTVWKKFHETARNIEKDHIGFHCHTVPKNQNAIEYNTCWTNNDFPEQSLAKRLIERLHFPSTFRAGGHIERNDLSYWLEQFIPFDFSCRSFDPTRGNDYQPGDINDWRGAPYDWSFYNPSFYDYRKKGSMKRTVFRALDIDSNACKIDEYEIEKAFKRAQKNPTILAVSTHDRRDMEPEIDELLDLIHNVSKRYKNVTWVHSNSLEAAQKVLNKKVGIGPSFKLDYKKDCLLVETDKSIFGPQPFLAVQENRTLFYRDNFTKESENKWVYRIPSQRDISCIAVAASSLTGEVGVNRLKFKDTD